MIDEEDSSGGPLGAGEWRGIGWMDRGGTHLMGILVSVVVKLSSLNIEIHSSTLFSGIVDAFLRKADSV